MTQLIPVSDEQLIRRIQFENPWWSTGQIDEYFGRMKPRLYFNEFRELLQHDVKRALVLMGPRRVGKTVILFHTIRDLINSGVEPRKICYLSIETPLYNNISLEQLLHLCMQASGAASPDGLYIFFDEIQYLKNWEVHLKSLVDSYHRTKFIASGSAAAALKLKSNESGAGRFTDFMLPPLTFREYIDLNDLNQLVYERSQTGLSINEITFHTPNIQKLNDEFLKYINYGGYPEILFSQQVKDSPSRYIKSDIIEKVLLRDLPSLYGIADIQELNSFFTFIAYQSGNQVSYEKLAQSSGVKKETLKKYLTYLESAYLIKMIHKVDSSSNKFKRNSQFKVYLTNPSLRSALFEPVKESDAHFGNIVETTMFAQMYFEAWYANWKDGEVDIVILKNAGGVLKPEFAAEVKWSDRFFENPHELKSLIYFCKENRLNKAVVTTIDKRGIKTIDGIEIEFLPASIYAYVLGYKAMLWGLKPR